MVPQGNAVKWSVADVQQWLNVALDGQLSEHIEFAKNAFLRNGIDGNAFLHINKVTLVDFGITAFGLQLRLLQAVDALRARSRASGNPNDPSQLDV